MKFIKKQSATVTCLLCLFGTSAATAQSLQSGTFLETDFGVMEVSCVSATSCVATYSDGVGFMYLTGTEQDGVFVGYWAEPETEEPCDVAREFDDITTVSWGKMELQAELTDSGWTGGWGYCDGNVDWRFDGSGGPTSNEVSEPVIIIGPDAKGRGGGNDF
jgi:hypothetical protein